MSTVALTARTGPASARIGPNAIIQTYAALQERQGVATAERVLQEARLARYIAARPTDMVDEAEVIALHRAVRQTLPVHEAHAVERRAGELTGEYLLAHRIPHPIQVLLRWLPASWAARILVAAIKRHAWTFAGSGAFEARHGRPLQLSIRDCPLCRQSRGGGLECDFYAGTFDRLFSTLVHPGARAEEITCQAQGADRCRFDIRW